MKKYLTVFLLSCAFVSRGQENKNDAPLEAMIAVINNSLDKASDDLSSSNLKIKKAEITLKVSKDVNGGGGFKLFVKASKKWEKEKTSSVTFSYNKVDRLKQKGVEFLGNRKSFEKNLTNVIVNSAKQWKRTTSTIDGLIKDEFTVTISFSVTKFNEAGVEFEVWGIGVDAGVDWENTATHSVKLTFK